VKWLVDY